MIEYDVKIYFEEKRIFSRLDKLVQNDYNSTKLNFSFDKTGSRVLFKLKYPDNTEYVDEIENNVLVFKPGILNQSGQYRYEVSMYGENNKLTGYAIGEFTVRSELVNTNEIVEPDDRVPVLDRLINQVDNLDIDAEKVDDTTTITLKKKDGTEKEVQIKDGDSGLVVFEIIDGCLIATCENSEHLSNYSIQNGCLILTL